MKRKQIRAILRTAGTIGKVHHIDYIDYVVAYEEDGIEKPYMTVAGRMAMSRDDHLKQGKRLDFLKPEVLRDDKEGLTLLCVAESEIHGRRHGIATSRKGQGAAPLEREHPWECAETSAIGRVLGHMGYGLLPGSGLASAEEIAIARSRRAVPVATRPTHPWGQRSPDGHRRNKSKGTETQRRDLVRYYAQLYAIKEEEAREALNAQFVARFGHPMEEASYEKGRQVMAELITALKVRRDGGAAA